MQNEKTVIHKQLPDQQGLVLGQIPVADHFNIVGVRLILHERSKRGV